MMTYQDLLNYLKASDKSFDQGLKLYNTFKHSTQFDEFFRAKVNPSPDSPEFSVLVEQLYYIEQKLILNQSFVPDMEKITQTLPAIELQEVRPVKQTLRISENNLVNIDELPSDLFIQYQQNKENWNKIRALHAELRVLPENPEFNLKRKSILAEINTLEQQCRDIWKTLEKWNDNRQDEALPKPVKEKPPEKQINSLRRQIARTKAFLKKPNLRKGSYDKYLAALETLQNSLNELTRSSQATQ